MSGLVLSLFPGIGLLDMAFEQEGFCVVRGPDLLWGGDVRRFHPPAGRFDGVIGGPPCQAFSKLQRLLEAQRQRGVPYRLAENLIPEFERVVREAEPLWFLMENVPDAPTPRLNWYFIDSIVTNNRWVGGEQNRVRRFSFGARGAGAPGTRGLDQRAPFSLDGEVVALESANYLPAVTASSGGREPRFLSGGKLKRKYRKSPELYKYRTVEEMAVAQGLPSDFLDEAPFTEAGKRQVIGNGVPLTLGRAVARAVRRALGEQREVSVAT